YTHQGGLYRDVSLVAMSPTHVSLNQTDPDTTVPVAGWGVYLSNSTVTTASGTADVGIKTLLDNQSTSAKSVSLTSFLVDAAGLIRAQQTTGAALSVGQAAAAVTQSATVASPHLWDGRIDPYRYD